MPRPTPAQLAYGSATVVCSTLAMLVLSRVQSGPGVALIAVVALAAGVLVAVTAPGMQTARRARTNSPARAGAVRAPVSSPSRIHARHGAPAARATRRVAEPSLRS